MHNLTGNMNYTILLDSNMKQRSLFSDKKERISVLAQSLNFGCIIQIESMSIGGRAYVITLNKVCKINLFTIFNLRLFRLESVELRSNCGLIIRGGGVQCGHDH